jgi:broad specificity phosphatase PhoE
MNNKLLIVLMCFMYSNTVAQKQMQKEIKRIQSERQEKGLCFDFVSDADITDFEVGDIQQIFVFRHGEPAINKKGWKNRKEAVRYIEMYDSVGVIDIKKNPICLSNADIDVVYTSTLPRAINTAEKVFNHTIPIEKHALFDEFDRKVFHFPNIKLPRAFWSVTSRLLWVMGFNDKGIKTFSQEKDRSRRASYFLNDKAENNGKVILFSHGFLNRYIKKYLKKEGYKVLNYKGQKYLGAYYFYKIDSKN